MNHVWVVEWWNGKKWRGVADEPAAYYTHKVAKEAAAWYRGTAAPGDDKFRVTKYVSTREGE